MWITDEMLFSHSVNISVKFISHHTYHFHFHFHSKGETIEVGAEDKIIRRESELVTIEKALRTSNLSIRKAMSQLEGFFMCENNKKDQVLKLALKVSHS